MAPQEVVAASSWHGFSEVGSCDYGMVRHRLLDQKSSTGKSESVRTVTAKPEPRPHTPERKLQSVGVGESSKPIPETAFPERAPAHPQTVSITTSLIAL